MVHLLFVATVSFDVFNLNLQLKQRKTHWVRKCVCAALCFLQWWKRRWDSYSCSFSLPWTEDSVPLFRPARVRNQAPVCSHACKHTDTLRNTQLLKTQSQRMLCMCCVTVHCQLLILYCSVYSTHSYSSWFEILQWGIIHKMTSYWVIKRVKAA